MKVAFQFPGQGSQSVGMLAELAEQYPVVQSTFAEASEALGYDLWALVCNGPVEELDKTEQTQPALVAAGIACWRVWQECNGSEPAFLAGHSLGEYSALVAADVLDFADGIRLVQRRAQLMQSAVPEGEGAMAALIGMDDEAVRKLCEEISSQAGEDAVLQAVNFNAPGQVVIAGHSPLIDLALEAATGQGARMTKRLPISVPCHSSLLKNAAVELLASLEATPMRSPKISIIHNIDALPHHEVEDIRRAMAAQLYSSVLWTNCVQHLVDAEVTALVECGPGRVLSGLARRINRNLNSGSLHDPAGVEAALQMVSAV